MNESTHIVVVDDCSLIRDAVSAYLGREGFEVSTAESGREMREILQRRSADLVIVDLQMPGEDGFSLTRFMRESCGCGIIMLTAKTDPMDRVVALEIGADDFIAKPYEPRELLARVRSVLRRLKNAPATPAVDNNTKLDFGSWQFDLEFRSLYGDGDPVELTTAEFNLLAELVKKPGRVLTREYLLESVYDRPWDYYDRSIDVLVTRLRRKLEQVVPGPSVIKAVRGAGYLFSQTARDAA